MRKFCVSSALVFLSACASAPPERPTANIQNVVYRVGDSSGPATSAVKSDASDAGMGSSKPMHVYWFLSGR
jgi:hypothetical protein